jgi:uncharacterized membrane protein
VRQNSWSDPIGSETRIPRNAIGTENMLNYAIAYCVTAVVFLGIDFVWLSRIARDFYSSRLGDQLLAQPRLGAAAAFYLVYVAGIVIFAIVPALKADSVRLVILLGAFFGLVAYATYDMTNYATLRNWPLVVVFVDIAWGTFLTALSAFAGFHAGRLIVAVN